MIPKFDGHLGMRQKSETCFYYMSVFSFNRPILMVSVGTGKYECEMVSVGTGKYECDAKIIEVFGEG